MIPIPSDFVDIMFTLNAMDHANHFSRMCREIIRVIKPGGLFIGSFNLEEPVAVTEPQRLSLRIIQESLLDYLEIESYRATEKKEQMSPETGSYTPFFKGDLSYTPGEEGHLWVRARKPRSANTRS